MGLVSVTIVLVANRVLLGFVGIGDDTLEAAGLATSAGPLAALFLIAWITHRHFGVFVAPWTLLRCLLSAAVGYLVAGRLPDHSAGWALLALLLGGLAYLAMLLLTGELGRAELLRLRSALGLGPARDGNGAAGRGH